MKRNEQTKQRPERLNWTEIAVICGGVNFF